MFQYCGCTAIVFTVICVRVLYYIYIYIYIIYIYIYILYIILILYCKNDLHEVMDRNTHYCLFELVKQAGIYTYLFTYFVQLVFYQGHLHFAKASWEARSCFVSYIYILC